MVPRLNERIPIRLLARRARSHQLGTPGGIAGELDAQVGLRDVGFLGCAGAFAGVGGALAGMLSGGLGLFAPAQFVESVGQRRQ